MITKRIKIEIDEVVYLEINDIAMSLYPGVIPPPSPNEIVKLLINRYNKSLGGASIITDKSGSAKEKFTARPWIAKEEESGFIEVVDKEDRLLLQIMSDGPEAKKSEGWVPSAEAEANKQLVLASPLLYRKLKSLTERMERMSAALQETAPDLVKTWLNDDLIKSSLAAIEEADNGR
jgi:hypothetical protein